MYQALYRTYRPRTFDDVAGQEHITETLKRQCAEGRLSHAYLFTGTRGTGKTSCAKILSRAVNCEAPEQGNPCNRCPACIGIEDGSILDVLELDAASNNGVDHVRALRDDAIYSPAAVRRRVYIVDEVHMLSTAAFNALLKIIEEPPAHLMFILATTELHKVPATIKSRCQQFSFKRILPDVIAARLDYVAKQEGIDLTGDGARLLARLAEGGMRDALSLLDQCAGGETVDEAAVLQALGMAGNVETARLLEGLAAGKTAAVLARLAALYDGGKDMKSILGELAALTRDLLVRKTAPREGKALLTGGYDETVLRALGERLTAPRLVQMLTVLQGALEGVSRSQTPRLDAELCLIRLADETLDGGAAGLSARVARLEDAMQTMGQRAEPPARRAASRPPAPVEDDVPPFAMDDGDDDEPPFAMDNGEDDDEPPFAVDDGEDDDEPPFAVDDGEDDDEPPFAVDDGEEDDDDEPPFAVDDGEEDDDEPPFSATDDDADDDAPPFTANAEGGDDAFWKTILPTLKGKISPQSWSFLSNSIMTTGEVTGDGLDVVVSSAMARTMIDRSDVLDAVSKAAASAAGRDMAVRVRMKSADAGDKFNDLMAMGKKFSQEAE